MRIIQVLNSPVWSASSAYCAFVSKELMKLGHEVLILTETGVALEQIKKLDIPYDNGLTLEKFDLFSYVKSAKYLKKVFKYFKPDIVSAHVNRCGWMPGFVAKLSYPDAVVVRVRTDIAAPNKHIGNLIVHHKWTDHIVCGSKLHKDICRKNLFLPSDKISVIYGGVDDVKFNPNAYDSSIRKDLNVSEDDFLVCLLGRLSPIKGHEYALKSIALLKNLPRKVKLICIGYEAQRSFEWVKSEAERLGIGDRVICMWDCNLPAVLNAIDVGIITSLGSEANSRATLEYMACGKPVVTTNVGVIPEIVIDGETGYVVNKGNSDIFAEALKKLVLNKELCLKMGKASRKRIEENFTMKQFGKNMEALYQKLLERKRLETKG